MQVLEANFEASVYELLRSEPNILAPRLLYYRVPMQHVGPRRDLPRDIAGRRLFVFERTEGENNMWWDLSPEEKVRVYVNYLSPLRIDLIVLFESKLDLSAYSFSQHPRITVQL